MRGYIGKEKKKERWPCREGDEVESQKDWRSWGWAGEEAGSIWWVVSKRVTSVGAPP